MHDDDSAVGAQQCTGLDLAEVRQEPSPAIDDAVDGAKQVLVGRAVDNDHGGTPGARVVDDDVHVVYGQRFVLGREERRPRRDSRLFPRAERIEVVEQVLGEFVQMRSDSFVLVTRCDCADARAHDARREFALDRADLLVELVSLLAMSLQVPAQLVSELLAPLLELGDARIPKGAELFLVLDRMPVDERDQGQAALGGNRDREARSVRELLECALLLDVPLLERFDDAHLLGVEALLAERLGQVPCQPIEEGPQIGTQADPLARSQPDRARTRRVGEVVDVDPVGVGCLAAQQPLDLVRNPLEAARAFDPASKGMVACASCRERQRKPLLTALVTERDTRLDIGRRADT